MYQKKEKSVQKNSVAHSVVKKHKSEGITLKDNRSSSIVQQKQVATMNSTKTIQQKKNSTGLPDQLKSGMESLSGHSMDDVKVHYNSSKPAQLNAHAYAQGTNIHIASGQEKHLPHEAWHVIQQKQGRVQPTIKKNGVAINNNQGLEKEADVMGAKALQRKIKKPDTLKPSSSSTTVQRAAVIQLALSGAWAAYDRVFSSYGGNAPALWKPRLERAEKAGIAPPVLTEHASGSGAGDRGNKSGQMSAKLGIWWTANSAAIKAHEAQNAAAPKKKSKGQRHTPKQAAAAASKKKNDKAAKKAAKKAAYDAR